MAIDFLFGIFNLTYSVVKEWPVLCKILVLSQWIVCCVEAHSVDKFDYLLHMISYLIQCIKYTLYLGGVRSFFRMTYYIFLLCKSVWNLDCCHMTVKLCIFLPRYSGISCVVSLCLSILRPWCCVSPPFPPKSTIFSTFIFHLCSLEFWIMWTSGILISFFFAKQKPYELKIGTFFIA